MNALQKTGNTVVLLDTSNHVSRSKSGKLKDDEVIWDSKKFPIYDYVKHLHTCDVLILVGTTIGPEHIENFKLTGPNKKVIKYACGNNYVIDMENMIHKKPEEVEKVGVTFNQNVDEVWYVPQQGYQNQDYYSITHRLPKEKVFPVPFVWDPMFIDEIEGEYGGMIVDENGNEMQRTDNIPVYQPGKKTEDLQLTIFEPNLNVVKFSMIPMLIAEQYLHKGGDVFNRLNIISAGGLFKNPFWKKFVAKLHLLEKKNKKGESLLMVQHRFPIHYILSKMTDIVISHQWENPLNYAYLDVMYLQFPLIHNADMIKDAGYFYPDFEAEKGAEILKDVIDNHDSNIDSYNERNEEVLTRYTVYNEGLVDTYKKLLENLRAGENKHNLSLEYNWKTNLYK
tara:strand:- start:1309 stop:2493 length:1185 start_codon:yes stop_codon:yes gene_type:complete